ncbi:MAG: hypothetical protein Kow0059_20540 [Candidatus Sumerlaeia bacterium]
MLYLFAFQFWCPGCHKAGFPTLTKVINHYRGDDRVALLAVQTAFEGFSSNSPEQAKRTADRYNLTIPVGHSGSPGTPSTVMKPYRTGGTPWTVIIAPDGVVKFNDFHITPEEAISLIGALLPSSSTQR